MENMRAKILIFYILSGLSFLLNAIASELEIHNKTTEDFINTIKDKLNSLFHLQDKYSSNSKKKLSKLKKCLIITISNQLLNNSLQSQHLETITAVLNKEYSMFNNYHYLNIYLKDIALGGEIFDKYPDIKESFTNQKFNSTMDGQAFNFYLRKFRNKSWAKIPILWLITKLFGESYKYIMYINPKAAISPWKRQRSINTMIQNWKLALDHMHSKAGLPDDHLKIHHELTYQYRHRYPHPIHIHYDLHQPFIKYGEEDISNSVFYFLNNFPFREDMPNSDIFFIKPGDKALRMLEQWWNANISSTASYECSEKDALWKIIDYSRPFSYFEQYPFIKRYLEDIGVKVNQTTIDKVICPLSNNFNYIPSPLPRKHFLINAESISVVQENQYPSRWIRHEESLWAVNTPPSQENITLPIFNQFLLLYSFHDDKKFSEKVKNISSYHSFQLDPFLIYKYMYDTFKISQEDLDLGSPINFEQSISKFWYNSCKSSTSISPLTSKYYYEGKLIRYNDQVYLISNGFKRKLVILNQLNIPKEVAFVVQDEIFQYFPMGKDISPNMSPNQFEMLFRYYRQLNSKNKIAHF